MKLIKKEGNLLYIKCMVCDKEFTVKIEDCFVTSEGYELNKKVKCPDCNQEDFHIVDYGKVLKAFDEYEEDSKRKIQDKITSANAPIKCPKCKCTQLTSNSRDFSVGKAVGGLALAGTVGLLGGFIGNKKIIITCLKCGYHWKAGK
ncbi:hypothetical protein [Clostridium lacusfryxellense]|uniref:hypothetical protein n=1 Tax=Clostridium lacusfryxellense TaxID=205328 RepID=UPI001C0DFF88|nr:hypothetical protein [Clostridium lacusfryxellense]MBU3114340.1 hypothetical protein [Clostridium lacusfryxellense]